MAVRTKTGHTRATREQILRFDVNLKKEEAAFQKRGRFLLLVLAACVSFFLKGPLLRVSQGGGGEACYVSIMGRANGMANGSRHFSSIIRSRWLYFRSVELFYSI